MKPTRRRNSHSQPECRGLGAISLRVSPDASSHAQAETKPPALSQRVFASRRASNRLGMLSAALAFCVHLGPFASAQDTTPPNVTPKGATSFSDLFPDSVLARGKGFEITQSQVDEMYLAFKSHRAAIGVQVSEAARNEIEAEILDKLISTRLCLDRATAADKTHAKELAEKFVMDQIRLAPSEDSFNRQLLAVGMTPEKFRAQVLEQAIVKTVIDREIPVSRNVSDALVREFYDQNPELFRGADLVRVSHILISTQSGNPNVPMSEEETLEKRKRAEAVLAQAKGGEDFATLVREFSDDEASKNSGGEYTIAHLADDPSRAVVPEFEAAAFSLAPNQISDVITTRYGFHIIKALEKIPAKSKELAAVADQIKATLLQREIEKALPDYINGLKKSAGVEILNTPKPAR